jgi:Uma2 family endonuclease
MSALRKTLLSPAEYLAIERQAERKSEYFAGEMFTMAGAVEGHNIIALNVGSELRFQLKKRPCKVYPSDMRVKIPATVLYAYPDVVVVCGKPAFEDEVKDTLLNPTLIVEVLSASTEAYDRGKKFEHYSRIPSFCEYVLITQNQHKVEQFTKQNDGKWLYAVANGLAGVLKLASIDCELALVEVYDKVEIE